MTGVGGRSTLSTVSRGGWTLALIRGMIGISEPSIAPITFYIIAKQVDSVDGFVGWVDTGIDSWYDWHQRTINRAHHFYIIAKPANA